MSRFQEDPARVMEYRAVLSRFALYEATDRPISLLNKLFHRGMEPRAIVLPCGMCNVKRVPGSNREQVIDGYDR